MTELLSAPYILEYAYKRSLGPVLSAFITGLRDGVMHGVRAADGRVLVPPQEYDPETGATLTELVEVGQTGTVRTAAWIAAPRPEHPLDAPFAWALIQLDGADTPMLHAVAAGAPSDVVPGTRVRLVWAEDRGRGISDISHFEPTDDAP